MMTMCLSAAQVQPSCAVTGGGDGGDGGTGGGGEGEGGKGGRGYGETGQDDERT